MLSGEKGKKVVSRGVRAAIDLHTATTTLSEFETHFCVLHINTIIRFQISALKNVGATPLFSVFKGVW
jgi:hypothetical protein